MSSYEQHTREEISNECVLETRKVLTQAQCTPRRKQQILTEFQHCFILYAYVRTCVTFLLFAGCPSHDCTSSDGY